MKSGFVPFKLHFYVISKKSCSPFNFLMSCHVFFWYKSSNTKKSIPLNFKQFKCGHYSWKPLKCNWTPGKTRNSCKKDWMCILPNSNDLVTNCSLAHSRYVLCQRNAKFWKGKSKWWQESKVKTQNDWNGFWLFHKKAKAR